MSTFALDLVDKLDTPACYLCGAFHRGAERICTPCLADLPRLPDSCIQCGEPWQGSRRCPTCIATAPPFDQCISAFDYAFPVREVIQQFKYQRKEYWARALAEAAAPTFRHHFSGRTGLLIPMPVHTSRLKERGFNQAELLANELSRYTGWKVETGICQRVRHTEKQSRLDARTRRANLSEAFVGRPCPMSMPLVIVDDVVTTGSTVTALSQVLRDQGATELSVFSIARARRHRKDSDSEIAEQIDFRNQGVSQC
ncbi:MAG: ComF family protein [Hahellaceae bacterium]|nr:ComF family protein [Hahellaceae bacterium]